MKLRWMIVPALVSLCAAPAARLSAQASEMFGLGAAVSSVNSVNHGFELNRFRTTDWNVWAQYQLESSAELRATFGTMKVRGYNGAQTKTLGDGSTVTLPELEDRIRYGLVGVAYGFREPAWTSALFAGIGAYGIDPESADPSVAAFRDRKETVWGLHLGLDADVRIWKGISVVGRVTMHVPQTHPQRRILTAGGGLLYRF